MKYHDDLPISTDISIILYEMTWLMIYLLQYQLPFPASGHNYHASPRLVIIRESTDGRRILTHNTPKYRPDLQPCRSCNTNVVLNSHKGTTYTTVKGGLIYIVSLFIVFIHIEFPIRPLPCVTARGMEGFVTNVIQSQANSKSMIGNYVEV